MTEKIFLTENKTVTTTCPRCGKSKTADASPYCAIDKPVRLKINCSCGHQYPVFLERRRHYRKAVDLRGSFFHKAYNGIVTQGGMTVKNLSRNGVRLRLDMDQNIRVGDSVFVDFNLDDSARSKIRKEVIARHKRGSIVDAEFASVSEGDPSDRALGFYLFN